MGSNNFEKVDIDVSAQKRHNRSPSNKENEELLRQGFKKIKPAENIAIDQSVGFNSAHALPVANQSVVSNESAKNRLLPHFHHTSVDDYKSKMHSPRPLQKLNNGANGNGNGGEKSSFEKELLLMAKEKELEVSGRMANKGRNREYQNWSRPPLDPDFDPKLKDITFQQLDAEETTINSFSAVRFFGVTEEGHSVLCNVVGFLHYFYVPLPKGLQNSDLKDLKAYLNERYQGVSNIEISFKESIWGYNNNMKLPFLKIVVDNAKYVPKLRSAFERGEVQFKDLFPISGQMSFDNIQYLLRMMVDCKITGMSWITLPKDKYKLVTDEASKISTCQFEASINYQDLVCHPSDGEYSKIAPLRVLSFDIECTGRKGIFPEPEHDAVIQIANVVNTTGDSTPFVRNVFTVNTCSPIIGSQIYSYMTEEEMLMKWREFIVKVDPDVIIGYNILNFDLPYLINRAATLKQQRFPYFSRLKAVKQEIKDTFFQSRAYGMRENKTINIEGRMQFDLLQFIQREYKLRSYTLNSVSSHFLNEQKEDVHHSIIADLQNGDAETRRRLAVYCLKDAYLPLRLIEKLMCLVNYTEMARVTGVPFSFLLNRGQQIKVISQLFRKCLDLDIVIPNMKNEGVNEEYEGATVIEPIRGYYDVPIATLDFASLYPSIMMAHNLCYTTLLNKQTIDRLGLVKDKDYTLTPNNDYFVKAHLKKGILPTILQELLAARKRAKQDLKIETDPFKKQVLNGRQLALKISANSVYGFTGATIGKLPCLAISSSVTAFGREMIEQTKQAVEEKYTKANGYEQDAVVIYGDTDSVMVKFGLTDLAHCMDLGKEAAEYVSHKFKDPIKLEFEKVYYPYLLINKKRYAGLFWTNTKSPDKMDTKGIETVRRDNCRLVQLVITKVLELILYERDVVGAQEFVKKMIADLLQNRVDLSQLVITKKLSRQDYTAKQAHVELAERMRKRDAGSAPTLGDRVPFVIIKNSGGKNYEKSEDPLYVLEHSLPIDTKYYLDNQLSNPIMRIFEPILGESKAKELLTGEHTRTRTMGSSAGASLANGALGGLLKFAKKREVCKNCKSPLDPKTSNGVLCTNCISNAPRLYADELAKLNMLEVKFSKLWTECQRCQGSLHQEVLCSNNDCPIFYMRTKAQKDVTQQSQELAKWDETAW